MAGVDNAHVSVWIALKRLDLNDDRVIALREVHIPKGTKMTTIVAHSFGLDLAQVTFKIRNSRGFLIPMNGNIPENSKQTQTTGPICTKFSTYALCFGGRQILPACEVDARPRNIAMTVINKSLKSRLQSIGKRIERLEELLPQMKKNQHEKMTKDIELLNQKLMFLHKRMEMAESYCWEGMFKRAPLW